jgi:hypothetical protein
MATLDTLQSFIDNAKQTPSGKVEWTDTSLKGLELEVKNLFSTNGFQLAANVINLQTLSGDNSQLAVVEADSNVTRNGMYFWATTQVVVGFNYPAAGGGYWNLIKNSTTAPVTQIVAGTNITVSPSGGTGVVTISAPTSTTINPTDKFIPYRINGTSFGDSPIKWDTAVFPQLSTVYTGITKGLFFDFSIDQYILGKSSNQIELNGNNMTTTVNSILQGFYFNTSSDTFLLGGNLSAGSSSTSAIGIWQPNTPANTSMFVGNGITVGANASTLSGRKIKVFIPTIGYKYIQLYDN